MKISSESPIEPAKIEEKSTLRLWIQVINPIKGRYFTALSASFAAILPNLSLLLLVTYAISQLQGRPRLVTWLELVGEHASRWVIPLVRDTPLEKGLPVDYQRWYIAPLLVVVGLAANLLRGFQEYWFEDIGEKISKNLRNELTENYLGARYSAAKTTDASLIASFLGDDSREIRQCFTRLCGSIPAELVNSFVYLTLLILLDTQLFVLFFVIFVPAGLIVRVTGGYLRRLAKTGIRVQTELSQSFLEKLRGWQTIQSLGSHATELDKFNEKNSGIFNIWRRSARAKALSSPTVEWLGLTAGAVVLVLALRRVSEGALPSTILTAFLVTVAQLSGSLQSVVNQLNSTKKGTAALRRMIENINFYKRHRSPAAFIDFKKSETFTLQLQTAHLENQTITIRPGDSLSIVGESGSGKSTLLDCIAGLQQNSDHSIYLETHSVPVSKNPHLSQHLRVAYLTQDPFFFAGSIADNVCYPLTFDHQNTQLLNAVNASLQLACLDGIDPMKSALTLSGGEKQRLAFARGFFSHPDLWLIDEGTSALDKATEMRLLQNLNKQTNKAVKIFVAHRPSMQKFASQTIVLSQRT
ncbi:MAG: hypothetical protein RJB13_1772 [Pseudomonadota bacterium]